MNRPALYRAAIADLDMVVDRDPSVATRSEALLHPGVLAIWGYRLSHRLYRRDRRLAARLVAVVTRAWSGGIEIHPGARIGSGFFIDHGAGVVIGETAVIGNDVTLFHQVTLGAVGWWHDQHRPAGERRHPELGDRVVIGANATLLGPITVGDDAAIGAQALVIKDVTAGSRVLAPPARPHQPRRHPFGRVEPQLEQFPALPLQPRHRYPAAPRWGVVKTAGQPVGNPMW
jgi:serine O-acetyltransferase